MRDNSLMLIKMLTVLILSISFIMWSLTAEADKYRHHDHNYQLPTNNYQIGNSDDSSGTALALATFHPFSFATKKWQGSINSSAYDGQNAVSFGLAKRFEDMDALFFSSYGQNNGKDALTVGALWRF